MTVAGRTYFAFSDFSQDGKKVVSYCGRTKAGRGWSHDVTVRNWACFYGGLSPPLLTEHNSVVRQEGGEV